jgi:hypothetical protein
MSDQRLIEDYIPIEAISAEATPSLAEMQDLEAKGY